MVKYMSFIIAALCCPYVLMNVSAIHIRRAASGGEPAVSDGVAEAEPLDNAAAASVSDASDARADFGERKIDSIEHTGHEANDAAAEIVWYKTKLTPRLKGMLSELEADEKIGAAQL
jgi:hypothetical protein